MNTSVVTTPTPTTPDCATACTTSVAETSGFSPMIFAIAVSACVIAAFTISFVVYIVRRRDCLFFADEENPPPSESNRVIARLNPVPAAKPGLDPAVTDSIPVIIFRPFKNLEKTDPAGSGGAVTPAGGVGELPSPVLDDCDINERTRSMIECAVCLGDYIEGERIKVVPACGHGFHADCIDLWLSAKSTCPICRCDLAPHNPASQEVSKAGHGGWGENLEGLVGTASGGAEAAEGADRGEAESRGAETGAAQGDAASSSVREATPRDEAVVVIVAADA